MRIQINLPKSLVQAAPPASTDPPLVQIGGDLVVIEVQGEMTFEGEPGNKVIGLLDLETMKTPKLYLGKHHLLHGKMVNLPRPLAVLSRITNAHDTTTTLTRRGKDDSMSPNIHGEGQEDDGIETSAPELEAETQPLEESTGIPPPTGHMAPFSSPPRPFASGPRDYSSDLSSPVRPFDYSKRKRLNNGAAVGTSNGLLEPVEEGEVDLNGNDHDAQMDTRGDESEDKELATEASAATVRTREFKVVAVVRKKIVFSSRPEPIVTATVLPD